MGGYGSGFQYGAKRTEEDYRHIKISNLHKWGYTKQSGRCGEIEWKRRGEVISSVGIIADDKVIRFLYLRKDAQGERSAVDYPVRLSWTECHFGSRRPWFLCPSCDRRVGTLYSAHQFVCRHCLNLNYQSTRERDFDRAARQADKIREKLGWQPGIPNLCGTRPKGMHHRTYINFLNKYELYTRKSFAGMMTYIGLPSENWMKDFD